MKNIYLPSSGCYMVYNVRVLHVKVIHVTYMLVMEVIWKKERSMRGSNATLFPNKWINLFP